MLALFFTLVHAALALLFFYLTIAFVTGAPFVPSAFPTAHAMIRLAHIKKGMIVYDLGSGEGRLLFLAAARGATAVGFEINPFLVLLTTIKVWFSPYRGRIRVRWKNFWRANLRNADVVFIYLLPWRMERLKKKLRRELKPKALVVSNSFLFPQWNVLRCDAKRHVFVFRV